MKRSIYSKLFLLIVILSMIIITQTGCGEKEPPSKTDFCLDTTCQITIFDDMEAEEAEAILDGAFKEIRRYEATLSKTAEGSDVDKINAAAGQWTEVSDETVEVIRMANTIAWESGGVFDITIGAVTDLWDFKAEDPKVPEAGAIAAALPTVNYQNITTGGGKVLLSDPAARMDLGGIAKGYIADKVTEYLEGQGITRAIINLGGNIVVLGQKDEETLWTIGIERPYTDRKELIGTIDVADATVVTSGIYERNFEENGTIYHHVLDPKTGYPVETDLDAVTITAAKGQSGFCDALSTTCLLLGKEQALKLIEAYQEAYPERQIEAALIQQDGKITQTDGMKLILSEDVE